MNDEKFEIGVFTPLVHKEFFRREMPRGQEHIPFTTIAEVTATRAFKYLNYYLEENKEEQRRQLHKTTDIFVDVAFGKLYEWVGKRIKKERRETLNLQISHELYNGHGELNEKLNELQKEFDKNKTMLPALMR
jgi:hypothetical protein